MLIDEPAASWLILTARCAIAAVFLVSGIHKAIWYDKAAAEFRRENVPLPEFFVPATIALHLVCSGAILLGLHTREAALLLALFTTVATLKVHCFWRMRGEERLNRSRVALAHLAVVGALLLLVVTGPGRLTL